MLSIPSPDYLAPLDDSASTTLATTSVYKSTLGTKYDTRDASRVELEIPTKLPNRFQLGVRQSRTRITFPAMEAKGKRQNTVRAGVREVEEGGRHYATRGRLKSKPSQYSEIGSPTDSPCNCFHVKSRFGGASGTSTLHQCGFSLPFFERFCGVIRQFGIAVVFLRISLSNPCHFGTLRRQKVCLEATMAPLKPFGPANANLKRLLAQLAAVDMHSIYFRSSCNNSTSAGHKRCSLGGVTCSFIPTVVSSSRSYELVFLN
ncbi:hypothetical protein BJ508DRAFT_308636 [Ascobolus immersus RN42]|uniref:Uncharacterized protein n=1 Tax=Ascobolus immersus RN42 TaxID=1160509 RepID=A0A3N4HZB5_ASCIM|nr:hypothetical protein BJ508DRAFT_308636 [Ascobolus immersus RN42]